MNVCETETAGTLRAAGYRMTQPRLAVLQVLLESTEQLSPYEIHRRGKTIYARLGLVTVYRTLELLDELGIARRVHSKGRCHGYALAEGDQHYLVCRRCGHVAEFPCKGMTALIESARQRTGFTVEEHLLELKGLCPDCQEKAEGARDGA
jgi:Fur family ferric uptake transcriptional regulator